MSNRSSSTAVRVMILLLPLLATQVTAADEPRGAPTVLPTAELNYMLDPGTETCPNETQLRGQVRENLGYDPFRLDAARKIVAEIRRQGDGYVGLILMRTERGEKVGERELSATDCTELAASLSLAVALAIDPMLPSRQTTPAPTGAPTPLPAHSATPVMVPVPMFRSDLCPRLPPKAAVPVRARFGIGPLLSLGTAPALAAGVWGSVGLRRSSMSLDVEGRRDLPAGKDAQPPGRVRASLAEVALVPCFHTGVGVVCALGALGALQGEGVGMTQSRKATSLHAAVGVRFGLEVPLSLGLSVSAHATVRAPLTRTSLEASGLEVWTNPALEGSVGMGVVGQTGL